MCDPTNKFSFPPLDKHYLCDTAYTRGFMTLYRNVSYWLSDFCSGNHLTTKEELFNHAHAKLRNVIERAFSVLKARFPIMKRMVPYPFHVQRDIVITCVTIHNFLRKTFVNDTFFEQFENETAINDGTSNESEATPPTQEEGRGSRLRALDQTFMINLRDQIANELYNSRT